MGGDTVGAGVGGSPGGDTEGAGVGALLAAAASAAASAAAFVGAVGAAESVDGAAGTGVGSTALGAFRMSVPKPKTSTLAS